MVTVGCDRASSLEALHVAASSPRCTPPSACTRTRHATASTRSPTCSTGRRWPSGSAGSTTTTTTRRATTSGRRSPPRSRSPTALGLPLVIHTREAWDDTFAILDAEGVPGAHDLPLLHRRARRGAPVPRSRRLRQLLRDRHVPRRAGGARGGGARAARADAGRDRQPVPRAGAAPRQAQPPGLGAARRRPDSPRSTASRPTRSATPPRGRGDRRVCVPGRRFLAFSSLTWAGTGDRPHDREPNLEIRRSRPPAAGACHRARRSPRSRPSGSSTATTRRPAPTSLRSAWPADGGAPSTTVDAAAVDPMGDVEAEYLAGGSTVPSPPAPCRSPSAPATTRVVATGQADLPPVRRRRRRTACSTASSRAR